VTERESAPFEISWQPAIVGRADHRNPEGNRLLAVDLTGFKNAEYVSRHHACIMEENAEYFLVAIRDRNPTFLNEQELEVGQRVALQPGDRVRVGRTTLIVNQRERMSHT
jgi:pSer/pThr/pTyr-binding forkhead associated (FHA) protein